MRLLVASDLHGSMESLRFLLDKAHQCTPDALVLLGVLGGVLAFGFVGIFIGPEGGFEEEEVALAMKTGANPVTLGKRILRTETAGLTMLSVLMFHLEGCCP